VADCEVPNQDEVGLALMSVLALGIALVTETAGGNDHGEPETAIASLAVAQPEPATALELACHLMELNSLAAAGSHCGAPRRRRERIAEASVQGPVCQHH
jgi:hypothetical protein